jgi:hypothetical protein
MTTGRINQVNIFTYSQKTQKLNNNLKQTSAPHADQQSHRSLTDASTHYTQHTIMPSFVESHSSLSQKKDKKHRSKPCAFSHYTRPHHPTRQNTRPLSAASRRTRHTSNNKRKQKTDTPRKRASPIFYQRRRAHGFPHTTTTAPINSILFYKTESVFPKL